MAKVTLDDLANLENQTSAVNTINTNNDRLETAIENTLSRDGSSPNQMNANLDMNANSVINLPKASSDTEPVRKKEFDEGVGSTAIDRAAAEAAADAAELAQTAAETAQTGAEAAQTAAEGFRDQAQTIYNNTVTVFNNTEAVLAEFETKYLGAFSTDPTLDNEGNALVEGALYWNTVSNNLFAYDGSVWQDITEVQDDEITNAKLSNMAESTIKGRASGAGTGDPQDLSVAQVKTILGIGDETGIPSSVNGLVVRNNTTSATTHILVDKGLCASDDYSTIIQLKTDIVKDLSSTFVEGTGNGGMVTGESLPTNGTVNVWVGSKADGTVDVFANNHATTGLSPTNPTGFVNRRLIGRIWTVSSAIVSFHARGAGDLVEVMYDAFILDRNTTNDSNTTETVSAPPNTTAKLTLTAIVNSGTAGNYIMSARETVDSTGAIGSANFDIGAYYTGTSAIRGHGEFSRRVDGNRELQLSFNPAGSNWSSAIRTHGYTIDRSEYADPFG